MRRAPSSGWRREIVAGARGVLMAALVLLGAYQASGVAPVTEVPSALELGDSSGLARDTAFRAQGQEPFWHLEIADSNRMRFVRLGEEDILVSLPVPITDRENGGRIYHALTGGVAIAPFPCTDSMSGISFETTVTVTLNGHLYAGCGGALE